ncbi:MAG: aldo/keto reductase [Acidimicrobiia bacterium]|nr:aldo/keto reductase [Acidimicrobiia bacterium]
MQYRRLGDSGIRVSLLSFGSWVTFGNEVGVESATEMLATAFDAGVNFFDNAESYARGESETVMGNAISSLGWPRHSYLVSTKLFWGIHGGVNATSTLNRKYLSEAIEGSLERLGLDHVDLVFCHRSDPDTPIEETVWAMSDMVSSGKAHYWGTSEWSADEIRAAWDIAERHHLHKPQMEQPQYNLLNRRRVEKEYARLYEDIGLGTTIWSPLASGLLSGKYSEGVPEGSRAATTPFLRSYLQDADVMEAVSQLSDLAREIGCEPAQLALAWTARNPRVSTVITGASRLSQLESNLGALDVLEDLDEEMVERIEQLFPL